MNKNLIVSWSGGKDSTAALYQILNKGSHNIISLMTTITDEYNRISIHGVRHELLKMQSKSLGIDFREIRIPKDSTNLQYESALESSLVYFRDRGINDVLFGDIFLEDVKKYRDDFLKSLSMRGIYPLWHQDSHELATYFINNGFKAVTTCVDTTQISGEYSGMDYSDDFLYSLPEHCDPCGENGEFHTFVYDGPLFKFKIGFKTGSKVIRDNRFFYTDLEPV